MTWGALSLPAILGAFAAATLTVAFCGTWLTGLADRLADRTGLGEALTGGVLLGAATSLSGTVVSITAALDDRPSLAFANAVGGIAAQTAFLALADLVYRRANLEHVAAELANVFQAALLCLMLSLALLAVTGPAMAIFAVHPVSLALPVVYVLGVRATQRIRQRPMWRSVETPETRLDTPDEPRSSMRAMLPMALRFALLATLLGLAGWVISRTGGAISDKAGLSETTVGVLFTSVATSTPELVTTLAAVRRGAVQLAMGGIIGGNSFDVLFLTASDIAYRKGELYAAIGPTDVFWIGVGLAMTSVLLLGLILREKHGPAGIGFESATMLGLYASAVAVQIVAS